MSERIPVFVYADDPISQAGVAAQLRGPPETYAVDDDAMDDADVAVVVTTTIDYATVCLVRGIERGGCPKVVLVCTSSDDSALMIAAEANVAGLLRRQEASPEQLAHAVVAAAVEAAAARQISSGDCSIRSAGFIETCCCLEASAATA